MFSRSFWAGLALTLLPFVVLVMDGRTLIGGDMLVGGLALIHQIYRWGYGPTWDPYTFCGLDRVGSSQGTEFYPGHVMFLILDPTQWILLTFALHQVLAYLCAYWTLGQFQLSERARLGGSLLYAYSPPRLYLCANVAYYGILTLAPLFVGLIERCRTRAGPREAAALALVGGCSLLSGGHQLVLITILASLFYAAMVELQSGSALTSRKSRMLVYLTSAILALGLYAPVAIPMSQVVQAGVMRGVSFPPKLAASNSLEWFSLGLLANPCFFGPFERLQDLARVNSQEHVYALGIFPLCLLTVAAMSTSTALGNRLRYWLLISLGGFFLALGEHNPAYLWLLEHVPGLANFRVPPRFLCFWGLPLMLGGAAGIEALETNRLSKAWAAFGLVAYVLFVSLGDSAWWAGHLTCLLALAGLGLLSFSMHRNLGIGLGIVATCTSWWLYVDGFFVSPMDFQGELGSLNQIKQQLPPNSRLLYALNPESPPVVGLSNALGLTALVSRATLKFQISLFHPGPVDHQSMINWTYQNFHPATFLHGVDIPARLATPQGSMLCCAASVTPNGVQILPGRPGFWFSRSSVVAPDAQALELMERSDFSPDRVFICDHDPGPDPQFQAGSPAWTGWSNDRLDLELGGQTGWLTVGHNYAPGWVAEVDGKPRPLLRGYTTFRSLAILPGDRHVTLIYAPPGRTLAFSVGGVSLLLIVLGLWSPSRMRSKETESGP